MTPMFSWPMMTGAGVGGVLYSLTSVPQIPATSIFISALSSGMSGIGYSRNSVLLGPVLTAAITFSTEISFEGERPYFLTWRKNETAPGGAVFVSLRRRLQTRRLD